MINFFKRKKDQPEKKNYVITIRLIGIGGDHLMKPMRFEIPCTFTEKPVVIFDILEKEPQ